MGEERAIDSVDEPVTTSSLVSDLRELGVSTGDVLLVHSSLSAIGWVNGGPQAVVDALQDVVTDSGTIVVPTHTGQYTDPATWSNPPVPDGWVETIRQTIPPFDPDVTPTRGMGAIPECFRSYPGVARSIHPTVSFAAWGAGADRVVSDHSFDDGLGEDSPLASVYDLSGDVLLLGVGHECNTSLHLAEYRADLETGLVTSGAPVVVDGEREYVEYEDIETNTDDFVDLGAAFERQIGLDEGSVGAAPAKLVDQRTIVDFAVDWFEANR